MAIQLELGLQSIRSYKRLNYTAWHALAEFIDNSTQAYLNNQAELDACYAAEGERLEVSIVYDRNQGTLRIHDNSIGMSRDELQAAMRVGHPPQNTTWRSKYGMGLKTAACWFGDIWEVRTKKLGSTEEYWITVDVEKVADGGSDLQEKVGAGRLAGDHYTSIEIRNMHQTLQGRTLGKIKDFLRSMYRDDLSGGTLTLLWQAEELRWDGFTGQFMRGADGHEYFKEFDFEIHGRPVRGWVGILDSGSRARAGFSILHAGRVVRGYPDSWRPSSIYGQIGGSNDLVNQRIVGEVRLDSFDVTHTKDNILWVGDEEEQVEQKLRDVADAYIEVARRPRRGDEDMRGPSDLEVQVAVEELQRELNSPEIVDQITIEPVPPPSVVEQSLRPIIESVEDRAPSFSAAIKPFVVNGYLLDDMSPNDPYVVVESTQDTEVVVVINLRHPHFSQLQGEIGVLNYLRHCTYDGISEWQARHRASRTDPDTIKLFKDRLLRIPFEIEMHGQA